jgi:putative transcriptional regulator
MAKPTEDKPTDERCRSDAFAAIYETAHDLNDAGVMNKRTLRRFDALCLTPVKPLAAEDIRALRAREQVSQAVFARHLNVTTGLISQWERGEKKPAGASLKLLTLVREKGLDAIA